MSAATEATFADVKPGDVLIEHYGYGRNRRCVTVARLTPTLIVVDGAHKERKYKRRDGHLRSGNAFDRTRVTVPTEGEIQEVRDEDEHRELASNLSVMAWDRHTMATLREVWAIVKASKAVPHA